MRKHPPKLPIGGTVSSYEIVKKINHWVYHARREHDVILKYQPSQSSVELSVLQRARHPNLINMQEVVQWKEHPRMPKFIAMDYVAGENLDTKCSGAQQSSEEIRAVGYPVASAIAYLHHDLRIVHNDVKPENILVGPAVKLIDYDIARPITDEEAFMGTFGFRSPQQMNGENTPANDVFGLGATMYFMSEGEAPFGIYQDPAWMKASREQQHALERKLYLRKPKMHLRDRKMKSLILSMLELAEENRPSSAEAEETLK